MSAASIRSIRLPLEHLNAELLAAPMASQIAFEKSLTLLDPRLSRQTKELWRHTEMHLAKSFPGTSLDELLIRRDAIWFGHSGTEHRFRIHDYLAKATLHLLNSSNLNPLATNRSSTELDLRNEWKWARFALPTDLLLVAMGKSAVPDLLISPSLRRRLADKGYAETHLHLKAAIDFPMLWESLQSVLYTSAREGMFEGPGADFDEGKEFAQWLIRVAVVRLLLGTFLRDRNNHASLFDFLDMALRKTSRHFAIGTASMIYSIIEEVKFGRLSNRFSFTAIQQSYCLLTRGYWGKGKPHDPMSERYDRSGQLGFEFTFMTEAFDYLSQSSDDLFEVLFWQCQRVRVRFYRHVVQRPMTPGLQFFTRTYARLSAPRKAIQITDFARSALRLSGTGIRSLEARVVPEDTVNANLSVVKEFHTALADSCIETGLVFHFSKSRGKDYEKGQPKAWGQSSHENPASNASGYRFANFYCGCRRQAMALSGLLRTYPAALGLVRGVDYCTDELSVPTWVLKPLLEHFHRAASVSSRYLDSQGNGLSAPRTTVHVGEDFVHLMGGLRRVGEAIEFLDLTDGDRIGHALALGVDPVQWTKVAPSVPVTRGERLLDLLWARREILRNASANLGAHLPFIENELVNLACLIFNRTIPLQKLDHLILQVHDSVALQAVGFPDGVPSGKVPSALTLLHSWLCDQAVYNRSMAIYCISTEEDAAMLVGLQNVLRAEVGYKGIVVEVNPTSNLLVGNLSDILQHPLWRLASPNPQENGNSLRVCLGSDDPVTFATSLPEEFQLLADTIVQAGFSSQDSDRWIEEARETGMTSRFTVATPKTLVFSSVLPPIPSQPILP